MPTTNKTDQESAAALADEIERHLAEQNTVTHGVSAGALIVSALRAYAEPHYTHTELAADIRDLHRRILAEMDAVPQAAAHLSPFELLARKLARRVECAESVPAGLREVVAARVGEYDDEDMADVGRALMVSIADETANRSGPLFGWHPAQCPSEVVGDLVNMVSRAHHDERMRCIDYLRSLGYCEAIEDLYTMRDDGLPSLYDADRAAGCLRTPIKPGAEVGAGLLAVPADDLSRCVADSALPMTMINAGINALDQIELDGANYVSGVSTDWDQGMVAVAVYRAMLAAAKGEE